MFPQIFGKYVLERELAAGGMARVYLATLRGAGGFEKRLVLKQIRPELCSDQSFIERFVAEAKVAVELSHANIVPVYELGVEQGSYYIAMELCEGVSLAELLQAGPLSPNQGAYVAVEVCRALDYAHRKAGIVHSDVTPRNVMIDAEGMVRLIDFGIAAPAQSEPGEGGVVFGSLGHMPPEQMRGGPLSPAADVFAVAVLLYEAWLGRPLYRRDTPEATHQVMRQGPPALAEELPELASLCPLLRRAVASEVTARPESAEELARPLRDHLRSVDLGDVARALGERVRKAQGSQGSRASFANASPPSGRALEGHTGQARGSTRASGVTQTFAANQMLQRWTAPQSAELRSRGAELPSTQPLCEIDSASSSAIEGPVTGVADHAELVSESEARQGVDGGVAREPELGDRTRGRLRARSGRARWQLAAWLVACVLGVVVLLWKGQGPGSAPRGVAAQVDSIPLPGHEPPRRVAQGGTPDGRALAIVPPRETFTAVANVAPSKAPTPSESAVRKDIARGEGLAPSKNRELHSNDAVPSEGTVLSESVARSEGRAGSSRGSVSQPSAHQARAEEGWGSGERSAGHMVRVTAEPSARVSVDQRLLGKTPLSVRLPQGPHQFVFYSELLGEEVSAQIVSDSERRVHADFTTAAPSVKVR